MASHILQVPFRRTHTVSLSGAIKQYISSKYEQHPDMFLRDLDAIDKLRSDAVNSVEPHVSGILKLTAYAAQLQWISAKFPIDIGVDFTWYPALGFNTSKPISQNNLNFERANILYNLAALYSQLAIALNRSTSAGLKSACNYLCLAAGTLAYLRDSVIPEMRSVVPEDMDSPTLSSIEYLFLAQAQECFWQKAIKDGLKDGSISRLAVKVSDFYANAAESGVKSDIISTEWIHHMNAKHHHFAAAAQYRAALDCLEKRKYGEEVARLQDSLVCVNDALREARYVNKMILGDSQGLKNRVMEDLKRAEKDNDMIYLNPVPPKSELKVLDRAPMVISKTPKEVSESQSMLGDHAVFGPRLFSSLVPYSVHVAANIYEERRNRLVNHSVIDELETMTTGLRELLQSLNLPSVLASLEKPLGLPPSILSKAEELRQVSAVHRLHTSFSDAQKLKENDAAIFGEGLGLLKSEKTEDERARTRFGTDRWTRATSEQAAPKLWKQSEEIGGYLGSAASSDEIVANKLRDVEPLLRILTGPVNELEAFVPSARTPTTLPPQLKTAAAQLRSLVINVSSIEDRRKRAISAIRTKSREDDINPILLAETTRLESTFPNQKIEAAQFEDLFSDRLSVHYAPEQALLTRERKEQGSFISKVESANTNFLAARRSSQASSGAQREREAALQKLEGAYMKYKEIGENIEVGRRFYNDLLNIVKRFTNDARTFVTQRREEANSMTSDLVNSVASLQISSQHETESASTEALQSHSSGSTSGGGVQVRRPFTDVVAEPEDKRPLPAARAPVREPLTAPLPTRVVTVPSATPGMWTPNVGIRFGTPGVAAPDGSVEAGTGGGPRLVSSHVGGGKWDASRGVRFS